MGDLNPEENARVKLKSLLQGRWSKASLFKVGIANAAIKLFACNGNEIRFIEGSIDIDVEESIDIIECASTEEIFYQLKGLGINPFMVKISPMILGQIFSEDLKSANSETTGCFVVMGNSGSGKSTLLRALGNAVIEAGEPTSKSGSIDDVILLLISRFLGGTRVEREVFIIDSFRELVYSAGGNALSGGISSGMLNSLTLMSQIASQGNLLILGAVNPMDITGSNDREQGLLGAINGACSGTISGLEVVDYARGVVKGLLNARHFGRQNISVDTDRLQEILGLYSSDKPIMTTPKFSVEGSYQEDKPGVVEIQVISGIRKEDRLAAQAVLAGVKSSNN